MNFRPIATLISEKVSQGTVNQFLLVFREGISYMPIAPPQWQEPSHGLDIYVLRVPYTTILLSMKKIYWQIIFLCHCPVYSQYIYSKSINCMRAVLKFQNRFKKLYHLVRKKNSCRSRQFIAIIWVKLTCSDPFISNLCAEYEILMSPYYKVMALTKIFLIFFLTYKWPWPWFRVIWFNTQFVCYMFISKEIF